MELDEPLAAALAVEPRVGFDRPPVVAGHTDEQGPGTTMVGVPALQYG